MAVNWHDWMLILTLCVLGAAWLTLRINPQGMAEPF